MVCAKIVNRKLIRNSVKENIMKKYRCTVCGYVYDPAENDNVEFANLPEDYACPLCAVGKDMFEEDEE